MNSIYINDPKITSELSENGARGVFVIEPLERGYGTTLGNSLNDSCYLLRDISSAGNVV